MSPARVMGPPFCHEHGNGLSPVAGRVVMVGCVGCRSIRKSRMGPGGLGTVVVVVTYAQEPESKVVGVHALVVFLVGSPAAPPLPFIEQAGWRHRHAGRSASCTACGPKMGPKTRLPIGQDWRSWPWRMNRRLR
jgi:hypothetical protein